MKGSLQMGGGAKISAPLFPVCRSTVAQLPHLDSSVSSRPQAPHPTPQQTHHARCHHHCRRRPGHGLRHPGRGGGGGIEERGRGGGRGAAERKVAKEKRVAGVWGGGGQVLSLAFSPLRLPHHRHRPGPTSLTSSRRCVCLQRGEGWGDARTWGHVQPLAKHAAVVVLMPFWPGKNDKASLVLNTSRTLPLSKMKHRTP